MNIGVEITPLTLGADAETTYTLGRMPVGDQVFTDWIESKTAEQVIEMLAAVLEDQTLLSQWKIRINEKRGGSLRITVDQWSVMQQMP